MAAPTNLGFEDAGVSSGEALSWTRTTQASYETMAGFGADSLPYEDFQTGWADGFLASFSIDDDDYLIVAEFAVGVPPYPYYAADDAVEDFDDGWGDMILEFYEATDLTAAEFDVSAPPYPYTVEVVEDFEDSWQDPPWTSSFSGTAALFDAVLEWEPFGGDFDFVSSFQLYDDTELTLANFDGASAEAVEDFEEVRAPVEATVVGATSTLTANAHPFSNGERVTVSSVLGYQAPTGLNDRTDYYICQVTTNTFKLATDVAGNQVVDVVSDGRVSVVSDPALFWNRLLDL